MGVTLRYPYEVRNEKDYFDDIENEKVPNDMLELASHIVDTKRGEFDPSKFEDRYEDALKELLKKKQKGEKIERPKRPGPRTWWTLSASISRSHRSKMTQTDWANSIAAPKHVLSVSGAQSASAPVRTGRTHPFSWIPPC